MRFQRGDSAAAKIFSRGTLGKGVLAAAMLAAVILSSLPHTQTAAKAAPPGPLEIVDRVLASDIALEDEGPYRLIDPVGPGGLRRVDAIAAVTSPTMQTAPYGGERTPYGQYAPEQSSMLLPPDLENGIRGGYGASVGRHAERSGYPNKDRDHGAGYGGRR